MIRTSLGVALGVILAAAGQAVAQDEASVLRESVGARGAELSAMELRPFDATLWTSLEGWTNGAALDAAATEGKVVLVGTWASWNAASTRLVGTMQSLKEKYGEQGLLVVGVHHPQGWDAAADTLTQRKADFLVAHDTSGKFRDGIKADQDPDFYAIDRAGQLRFADIRNESIEDAVKLLLAEDASAAGGILTRLEQQAKQQAADLARPKLVQGQVNMNALPEVPFVDPPELAYQAADWPEPTNDDDDRGSRRDDETGPVPIGLPSSGWLSGAAPVTRGRAVAYYTFTLEDSRSGAMCRRMDQLQHQLGRDVVVVGVLTLPDDNNRRDREAADSAATLAERGARFQMLHDIQHPILVDPAASVMEIRGRTNSRDRQLSTAMVVSSDGLLRWSGITNDPSFRSALDRVVYVDPGLQSRRAAEAAFIRAKGG